MTAKTHDSTPSATKPPAAKQSKTPVADSLWLFSFVLQNRSAALKATIFGMIAGLAAAIEPYLVGVVIDRIRYVTPMETFGPVLAATAPPGAADRVIAAVPVSEVGSLVMLMLLLASVTIFAFFGQRYYSGEIAYGVNFEIRRILFDNMLTLENAFYQRYPTGDLISRMHSDIVMIWRLFALTFTRMGSAIMTVIIAFALLSTVSLPLTIIVFVVLAISTALQMRAGLVLAPVFERVQDQAGTVSALVQDSVSGIQTVKTTGREADVARQFRRENIEYRRRWLHFKRRNEPVGMLPNMISEFTAAVVILIGGVMTINGTLTIGSLTQFIVYLALISIVLLQIGTVYQRYQQTRGALTRLTPLLQPAMIANKEQPRRPEQIKGEIVFENVGVKIENEWLLQGIDLRIPVGKVVAIVGPTGCGKTLLVNLLARVIDPTEGSVRVDGVDVRDLDLDRLRDSIAYVPQSTFLFSQELHKNVRMGKHDIAVDEMQRAIHISRMSNDLPQLPHGLETRVGERGVMLSGGQKQRVAIARAIVRDPSILVLDDALSSVDMHTAADILHDLRDVLKTRTSIIIAHRIATVKDADLILVMKNGRIVEQGTHQALLAQGGEYAHMVERELKEGLIADGE